MTNANTNDKPRPTHTIFKVLGDSDFTARLAGIPFSTLRRPQVLGEWLGEESLQRIYEEARHRKVADVMTRNVRVVDAGQDLTSVLAILERGMVAPVVKDGRFQGLITKIDVLNHLRLHPEKPSP